MKIMQFHYIQMSLPFYLRAIIPNVYFSSVFLIIT